MSYLGPKVNVQYRAATALDKYKLGSASAGPLRAFAIAVAGFDFRQDFVFSETVNELFRQLDETDLETRLRNLAIFHAAICQSKPPKREVSGFEAQVTLRLVAAAKLAISGENNSFAAINRVYTRQCRMSPETRQLIAPALQKSAEVIIGQEDSELKTKAQEAIEMLKADGLYKAPPTRRILTLKRSQEPA